MILYFYKNNHKYGGLKVKCSKCSSADTKVIESREVGDGGSIRRRRSCILCEYRFTTYERVEQPQLVVVKNDNTRELFNRSKLMAGVYRSCEKTPVTGMQVEMLVSNIERNLQEHTVTEVPSTTIGDLVMQELSQLNEVAYVRFASVYRKFKDIESFEKELLQIKENYSQKSESKI